MRAKELSSGKQFNIFNVFNIIILAIVALSCILPILHVLAMSLSDNVSIASGKVVLIPVNFTFTAYDYLLKKQDFFRSVGVSALRVLAGTIINMLLVVITAYPLSRYTSQFAARNRYMLFFAITLFIGGGLIPTYMVIKSLALLDNFWVLILPGAVNIWNVIIMMNFMRGLPRSVEEAAFIDGSNHLHTLVRIILPMSLPALASILLFTMIGHWNSWFDGIFYMNTPEKYPMASYLATQIINNNRNIGNMTPEQLEYLKSLNAKAVSSAQLFISIIPILVVYPFLQRFFIKGIVVGSVKE